VWISKLSETFYNEIMRTQLPVDMRAWGVEEVALALDIYSGLPGSTPQAIKRLHRIGRRCTVPDRIAAVQLQSGVPGRIT
jgi:hypothetical protein